MRRLLSVLLWSVLAAAFIGPGTVTTAAAAGGRFGARLMWALLFSTVACIVLQEASARLTLASGLDLGQALRRRWARGPQAAAVLVVALGAVVLGCAAYEAGNILGGVAGAELALPLARPLLTLTAGAVAALLLWFNSPRRVALLLSLLVALMGLGFLWTAWVVRPPLPPLLSGALIPALPEGSTLLALALVGTTVVPYNLFLGSGLARGQRLSETRFGIAVAVGLGGLISAGVMVVGGAVEGEFGFAALAEVLRARLGPAAPALFAFGLLAAGLSSAITAPLAAAMTARSLLAAGDGEAAWDDRSWRFRAVWLAVLATGVAFGVSDVRPVPAIVLAQALNGVLLPLVAVFLMLAINDRRLVGEHRNRLPANLAMLPVVAVSVLLGVSGLLRAMAAAAGRPPPAGATTVGVALAVAGLAGLAVWRGRRR